MNRNTAGPALTAHRQENFWVILLAASSISIAAITAYFTTFSVPLLYDDLPAISNNPSIRHWDTVLFPPADRTVSGRPVLNLSLAANYAISGTSVWSYHAANLVIHLLAGLTLFGIIRRTLEARANAVAIAFSVAAIWTLHPLQTESVTYIVQRAESLMGLFYLLTLYFFILGTTSDDQEAWIWYVLSIAACLLGMCTKEVMVSAPLIVLLYDRAFIAGSFKEAWRARWPVYSGFAATLLVLAFLIIGSHGRGGTAGFGSGVPWWSYALTQGPAIIHYLWLTFWPQGLVFNYGSDLAQPTVSAAIDALAVICLVAATVWALTRKPKLGFLGACFLAILAPSSSVIPIATETMAEHRMYLALIPPVVMTVVILFRLLGRGALPACIVLAAALGLATASRNDDYSSALTLWSDTVSKVPGNFRAQNSLGAVLADIPGRLPDAIAHYKRALAINPYYVETHSNLGVALSKVPGRLPDAIAQYKAALELDPANAGAHYNLGLAYKDSPGHVTDAISEFEASLRINPDNAGAHNNLGALLAHFPSRIPDAISEFEAALRIDPDDAEAHNNLGLAYAGMPGRMPDASDQFEAALRINPAYADAHDNLGMAYAGTPGRLPDAVAQFQEALKLNPDNAQAHYNLGLAYTRMPGYGPEVISEFGSALQINPDFAEAHFNLGCALLQAGGRIREAKAHFDEAVRLRPDLEPMVARMRLDETGGQ